MEFEEGLADEPKESVIAQFSTEVKQFWTKRSNSGLTWAAFILLDIANVLTVIWFAAPGWGWTKEIGGMVDLEGEYYGYYGIWYACWDLVEGDHRQSCQLSTDTDSSFVPEYWVATQALSICVLVLGLAAFGVICVYMFNTDMHGNTNLLAAYIGVDFTAAALNVAMFVVFCVEFIHHNRWVCCGPEPDREVLDYNLWYAFGLSCASHAFYVASGIAAIFEYVDIKKEARLRELYSNMEARRANYPYSFEEASVDRFRPPYLYLTK